METLVQLLTRCESLLKTCGEEFWSEKINCILDKFDEKNNEKLVNEILSWFGSMGSLNDVIISEFNGHIILGKSEKALNHDLDILRSKIYDKAMYEKKKLTT